MQFLTFAFYPVFMSIYWIVGSIYFYFTREIRYSLNKKPDINVDELEGITFLLACYNESETIEDTLSNVLALKYEKKKLLSLMMEVQIIQQNSSIKSKKIMTLFSSIYKKTEVKPTHSIKALNRLHMIM